MIVSSIWAAHFLFNARY